LKPRGDDRVDRTRDEQMREGAFFDNSNLKFNE
jgi:hypothetical protein